MGPKRRIFQKTNHVHTAITHLPKVYQIFREGAFKWFDQNCAKNRAILEFFKPFKSDQPCAYGDCPSIISLLHLFGIGFRCFPGIYHIIWNRFWLLTDRPAFLSVISWFHLISFSKGEKSARVLALESRILSKKIFSSLLVSKVLI